MKLILCSLAVALFLSIPLRAVAGSHTPNVCTNDEVKVCAHLMYEKNLTSQTEGEFIIHFLGSDPIDQLKVSLWMDMGEGHGHGSAPVEIIPTGNNQFRVQNAWFVMPGSWIVRLNFSSRGQTKNINIPVSIKE